MFITIDTALTYSWCCSAAILLLTFASDWVSRFLSIYSNSQENSPCYSLLFLQCYYHCNTYHQSIFVCSSTRIFLCASAGIFYPASFQSWSTFEMIIVVDGWFACITFAWHLDLSGRTRLKQLCYKILPQYLNYVLFWFRWDTYYRLH